jgi:hypothetical protein
LSKNEKGMNAAKPDAPEEELYCEWDGPTDIAALLLYKEK